MKKFILLICLSGCLLKTSIPVKAQLSCPNPPPGYGDFPVQVPSNLPVNGLAKPGYQLVFHDEFDTDGLAQNWDFDCILDIYNNPVRFDGNCWLNVPSPYNDNVVDSTPLENYFIDPTTKDLKLRVTALNASHFKYGPYTAPHYLSPHYTGNPSYSDTPTSNYSGAMLISNSIFYHGYMEIEAKFPPPGASYVAFWFNNREEHFNDPYPDTHREIDVIDDTYYPITSAYPFGYLFNTIAYQAIACCFAPGGDTLLDLSRDFHIYACDWESDSIKYYLDNQLIASAPNTAPYDGRVQMILSNSINGDQLANYPNTGLIQGQNDFEIKYVRVWQKTNDLFNYYFINLCDVYAGGIQVWKNPGGFFATPTNYPPYSYAIETDYITGTSYNWTSSDSNKLIIDPPPSTWTVDSFAENGSRCYFHGITPGKYFIYLNATLPKSVGGMTITKTIPITILPDSLPTPTIHYSIDSSACNYQLCVDTVPGANSYTWSRDGKHWSVPLPDICPSNLTILPDSAYFIQVQALYISCNSMQLSSPVGTLSGYAPPFVCDTAKVIIDSMHYQNLVRVYPSPSDGQIWIENDFTTQVMIRLMLDTGATLSTFVVEGGGKIEVNNLPEGMIILEAVREDNHEIVARKLFPVIRH